jgi:dethiobiotin synthetase
MPDLPASARGLFITGTDTGVGKTHIAALILRELCAMGFRTGAYKPVCSGAVDDAAGLPHWDDLERLQAALRAESQHLADPELCALERIGPQRFLAPLAPPLAARLEGREVDLSLVDAGLTWWLERVQGVIIEGAGGWFCPLTMTTTLADWVDRWGWPVLIVARRGLGTINHTLLTIEAIRRRGLTVAGVVLNETTPTTADPSLADNAREIEARSGVPVFGEVLAGRDELHREGRRVTIHWRMLLGPARPPDRLSSPP